MPAVAPTTSCTSHFSLSHLCKGHVLRPRDGSFRMLRHRKATYAVLRNSLKSYLVHWVLDYQNLHEKTTLQFMEK